MADSLRVRPARREDAPRILELERELATFEKLPPQDEIEGARLLAWIFDEERGTALVAERGGRIEGLAVFWEGWNSFRARTFLYLEDLIVAREARGRGTGEALVAAVAREAVRRNAARVEWAVLDWNASAMGFYRSLGARPQSELIRYTLEGDALERLATRAGTP